MAVPHMLCMWLQALEKQAPITDVKAEKQLVQLLSTPLDKYDVVTVLELANYPSVMSLLRPAKYKVRAQQGSRLAYIPLQLCAKGIGVSHSPSVAIMTTSSLIVAGWRASQMSLLCVVSCLRSHHPTSTTPDLYKANPSSNGLSRFPSQPRSDTRHLRVSSCTWDHEKRVMRNKRLRISL